jgi:succinyl-CoA synthetase beta subunit
MRLYEHEAKRIFELNGIPTPKQFGVIKSIAEIEKLEMQFPSMVKASVLIGGRGKAGGVKKVKSKEEAKEIASQLLDLVIKDYPVEIVFFEEAVEEVQSVYLGVTMEPKSFNNMIIVSPAGGVDIEEVATTQPELIYRYELKNNEKKLPSKIANELADKLNQKLNLEDKKKAKLVSIITNLYNLYQNIDARLCEINPLIITPTDVVAADAKIVLDDNGLYRQGKLLESIDMTHKRHDVAEPTTNEIRSYDNEFPYVDLLQYNPEKNPDKLYVGLVPGGAGYGILSIDEVANIGNQFFDGKVIPINFMDSGGGPPVDRVAEMFYLLMDYPLVDMIITSRFGGISSCDIFIRGLIKAFRERYKKKQRIIPVIGRMVGTDLPSAKKYLEQAIKETPDALELMSIEVGNERIMAEVIKDALTRGFELRQVGLI